MKNFFSSVLIFIISSIVHNLYKKFPSFFTIILAPVNESIWEHMKMIFSSYIIFSIIKFIYHKIKNKKNSYSLFNEVTFSLINILIFLIIYLPLYYLFGENLVITLIIYFFTILITRQIKIKNGSNSKAILLIIFIYITFNYLSYNPPKLDIFRDPTNNTYGLNK